MYPIPLSIMKFRFIHILAAAIPFLALSCNSERGEPREDQLEKTAATLEAKAEKILDQTKESAALKEDQASKIREEKGDSKIAETLEKDAEVTLEVGKLRADQLEKQAEVIRQQKEEAKQVDAELKEPAEKETDDKKEE
jgi:hypothetical protein